MVKTYYLHKFLSNFLADKGVEWNARTECALPIKQKKSLL